MTQSVTTARNEGTGNGSTTAFSFTFPISAETDISVYEDEVLQALTTDYTVSVTTYPGAGTVNFVSAPASGVDVLLVQNVPFTQPVNYTTFGAFTTLTNETALDRATMNIVRINDKLDSFFGIDDTMKASDKPTMIISEEAAARASKVLAFNAAGTALTADTEIGNNQGDWATATSYVARDIILDTTNSNVYICNTAHTSSGSEPISSNADVAKWDLILNTAAATVAETNAAASAVAALASQVAAASSATAAASSATSAASSATSATSSASTATTQASAASTSATAAAGSATSAASDAVDTAADAVSTASDAVDTAADVTSSGTNATNAASSASTATTQASAASTSATAAATSATSAATSATTATTQASAASTSASAAAVSAAAAAASADGIDDVYLGAKSSDPATDNDGDALNAGDWYWNTTSSITRIYNGSAWEDVSVSPSTVVTKTSTTGSAALPAGTTVQRDGSPSAGYLRWNTSDTSAEVYDGSGWVAVGGGNTTTEGLYEHAHTISANYSITSGNNALTAGPITIDTGVSVTIPTGSAWVIA